MIHEQYSFEQMRKGENCTNCGRFVKIDRRMLNNTMMRKLVALIKHTNADPTIEVLASRLRIPAAHTDPDQLDLNADAGGFNAGDFQALRHWGFIKAGKKFGLWTVTQAGIDFYQGKITAPEAAMIENYRSKFLRFDGPETTFRRAWRVGIKDLVT